MPNKEAGAQRQEKKEPPAIAGFEDKMAYKLMNAGERWATTTSGQPAKKRGSQVCSCKEMNSLNKLNE